MSLNFAPITTFASGGGLVSVNVGLMIWTFIVFGLAMLILAKYAFPRIQEALDKRQRAIEDSIEHAAQIRAEADELLVEYRERLTQAREQAEEIVARARKAAETREAEALTEAKHKQEELMQHTRHEIELETQRAIRELRSEVADLTVMATEKVTRKVLSADDQKKLIGEALNELDFATLGGGEVVEEIAEVYARALFEVAVGQSKLDVVRDQLGEFANMLANNREVQIFFFSPYFSTEEKKSGLSKGVSDADPAFINFLQLLLEKHRMPAIFRIRRRFDALWQQHNRQLPVQVTSAIALDEATIGQIGDRIARQTGHTVDLTARVDPEILGGMVVRVGNSILDASIRNRLEQLRKQVAKAA